MSDSAKPEVTETVDENTASEAPTGANGVAVDDIHEKPGNTGVQAKSTDSVAVEPPVESKSEANIVDDVAAELAKAGTDDDVATELAKAGTEDDVAADLAKATTDVSTDDNTIHSDGNSSNEHTAASAASMQDKDVDHSKAGTGDDNKNKKDEATASVSDETISKPGNFHLLFVCILKLIPVIVCRRRQR